MIYNLLNKLCYDNWIKLYIFWELSLVKELGFEINLPDKKNSTNSANYTVAVNNKVFKIPRLLFESNDMKVSKNEIKEALIFNKSLLMENFIFPNKIKFPLSRNILEKYFK